MWPFQTFLNFTGKPSISEQHQKTLLHKKSSALEYNTKVLSSASASFSLLELEFCVVEYIDLNSNLKEKLRILSNVLESIQARMFKLKLDETQTQ